MTLGTCVFSRSIPSSDGRLQRGPQQGQRGLILGVGGPFSGASARPANKKRESTRESHYSRRARPPRPELDPRITLHACSTFNTRAPDATALL